MNKSTPIIYSTKEISFFIINECFEFVWLSPREVHQSHKYRMEGSITRAERTLNDMPISSDKVRP